MFHVEPIEILNGVLENQETYIRKETVHLFSNYQKLILKWNHRINLISCSDEYRIVTRHFLQSIGLLKVITFPMNSRILDIGSGAGFPGVPIKIIRPDIQMVLAESIKKKALFLKEIVYELHLVNTQILAEHIDEDRFLRNPVDYVIARAVTNLSDLVRWSFPSLKPKGKLIAVKGIKAQKEADELKRSNNLHINNINIIPYNPYPEIFSLKESFIILVER